MTRSGLCMILVLMLWASPLSAEEPLRTFTNLDGLQLQARLLDVSGNMVTIEVEGGRTHDIQITSLSIDDQTYIAEFANRPKLGREQVIADRIMTFRKMRGDQDEVRRAQAVLDRLKDGTQPLYGTDYKPTIDFPKLDHAGARMEESDHFIFYSSERLPGEFRRDCEKLWEICAGILPRLTTFYETERTPGGETFKSTIYWLEPNVYQFLLRSHSDRFSGSTATNEITRGTTFSNFDDRLTGQYHAFDSSRHSEESLEYMTDNIARLLLRQHAGDDNDPYWLSVGFGYYMEDAVHGICVSWYSSVNTAATVGGTDVFDEARLERERAWKTPLKYLTRKERASSLEDVTTLNSDPDQTAENYAFSFALTAYLIESKPDAERFNDVLRYIRLFGWDVSPDELAITLGFPNPAAMESDWYEWIINEW